mgnify:CR=1 FL=1
MRIIRCTEQEFNAICGLIDAGIRATGLRAIHDAAAVASLLERAENIFDEPVQTSAPVLPEA